MNADALRAIERDTKPLLYGLGNRILLASWPCMKLVPAEHIIRRALRDGHLEPGGTILESTSGTLGLGLARVGRAHGCPVRLVGDPSIDATLRAKFALLGAEVDVVEADASGSFQKARLRRLEELRLTLPGSFWVQQYDNPHNAEAYEAIADHIDDRLGGLPIDHVVSPHGSGGSGAGIACRLRERRHPARLVAVDTPGSVLFGCADRPRLLRGLGNSLVPRNVRHTEVDEVQWVPAKLAFAAAISLYAQETLDLGPTSGAAVFVARELASRRPGETVLVICPDGGERYRDTVLSRTWLAGRGLLADVAGSAPKVVTGPQAVGDEWARMAWERRRLDEVASCAVPS